LRFQNVLFQCACHNLDSNPKQLVIPNRAEGAVRNLLFAVAKISSK